MLWFIFDEFGVVTTERTIRRLFRERQWSRKVMRQVAKQRSQYLREDWIARIKDYHRNQFVFVDESACNQRSMDRKYGWSPVNTPAVGIQALKREKRWSLLPAYTIDGYLPGYLIHQGSVTKEMFIDWL